MSAYFILMIKCSAYYQLYNELWSVSVQKGTVCQFKHDLFQTNSAVISFTIVVSLSYVSIFVLYAWFRAKAALRRAVRTACA